MHHIIFEENESYSVALLIKTAYLRKYELERHYVNQVNSVIPPYDVIAFDVAYGSNNKVTVTAAKQYLNELLPVLEALNTRIIYCCDAAYFKALTGQTKAEALYGYVMPCKIKGFEHFKVVLGTNYGQLVYNPELVSKLDMSLGTLMDKYQNAYKEPGTDIIKYSHYPETTQEIAIALASLHEHKQLAMDIEAFSLHPFRAGVGTIGAAWSKHEGIAFACDYRPFKEPREGFYGEYLPSNTVRGLIKKFFEDYQGTVVWHNSSYDLKVLIAVLWMEHSKDYKGLLRGISVLTRNFEDTKLLAYLCLNSTAGNQLSLKELAQPFAGNYAQDDIKDIRKIPLPQLLEYNLVDCLSTNYVHEIYWPMLEEENQKDIYDTLFKPAVLPLLQMELVGMPMSQAKVQKAKAELTGILEAHSAALKPNPYVQKFNQWYRQNEMEKANATLKVKQHPLSHFDDKELNPGSGDQLQVLLFEIIGLPVLDYTPTKQPATGRKVLQKLKNHTNDPDVQDLLDALIGINEVDKILSSFIPSFEDAYVKEDGLAWLHGSFNLGGTVSGRLSSSGPNLQQIPSGSIHGHLIKDCFSPCEGGLMVGADFSSLEDRINALLTGDINKQKVYTDGFDGHSLRTFHYWPHLFPGMEEVPEEVNSIKKTHEKQRELSKTPTFALTFQGTWMTLVKTAGFSEEEAKKIEANYHTLYEQSGIWVNERILEASRQGFSEAAFGLKIRAPLLAQTMMNRRSTPYEAQAEARTLGNAISGQSYGLLNIRAANALMKTVWASKYKYDILPIAQIHDAQYFLVKDDVHVLRFLNHELIKEMSWQELPEIQHDVIKMEAELDIFWPSWAYPVTIPNEASEQSIRELTSEHIQKMKE